MANNAPVWAIECRKAMIDRGMNTKQLADEINVAYNTVCSVLTGYIYSENVAAAICAHLGVER